MVTNPDGTAELALLHSLGHLCFATIEQLHTLVFGHAASSTVRLRVAALRRAGLIDQTPWRLPRVCQERGSVWTLTPTGRACLQAYGVQLDTLPEPETAVPSTALERDEWRVRMAVRSLLVRVIMHARVLPTFADARVHVRSCWPTPYAPPLIHGDATLKIVWAVAVAQGPDWLPWRSTQPLQGAATCYLLVIDRPLVADAADGLVQLALQRARQADATAVIVWETAERLQRALRHLQTDGARHQPVRMMTQATIDRDLLSDQWRAASGRMCSLRPQVEEHRVYYAPTTA